MVFLLNKIFFYFIVTVINFIVTVINLGHFFDECDYISKESEHGIW